MLTMCVVIQKEHIMLFLGVNTAKRRNLNSNSNLHLNLNSVDGSFCRSFGRLFILFESSSAFERQLAMTPVVTRSSDKTVGDCRGQSATEV